ncbi:MAG: S-layer homology domain-containing protein [Oscillospiraceae bacterium]|nr:S-layer homology domain-containing protein [Oscillospiraceae bacterium]
MKNLKKSLALVLAIVMVFSLVVFANAEFADADQISPKFADACGVMNGLGILKGDQNGNFNPQGNLTRGQAMKIITYLKLGKGADSLTATSAPFNDVPATAWEAPFVAYCKNAKITNGYGDGNFGKDDELSGYAFAKFLLAALGYGANDEYVGDQWKIAVASDALAQGLFKGIEGYLSDEPLPREVAAQLAFNAAQITPVKYISILEMYQTVGAPFCVSPLGFDPKPVNTVNAEGRPVKQYKTTGTPAKVLYETGAEPVFTTVDGFTDTVLTQKKFEIASSLKAVVNGDESTVAINGAGLGTWKGATIDFYGAPNASGKIEINAVVVTDYVLGEITAINPTTKAITLKTDGFTETYAADSDSGKLLAGFAKGDMLCIAANGAKDILSAAKAEVATGEKVTAKNATAKTFKIDGTQYTLNHNYSTLPDVGNVTKDFYLDANGYVIGAKDAAIPAVAQTDFVYIAKLQTKAAATGDMISDSAAATAKADAIFADGTHKTIDLAITVKADGKSYFNAPAADGSAAEAVVPTGGPSAIGNWFAYTEVDGAYVLNAIDGDYAYVPATDVTLAKGTGTEINSKYTTSSTKLVEINAKYAVTETTGLPTAAKTLAVAPAGYTKAVLVTYAKGASTVSAIYVVGVPVVAPIVAVTYARAIAPGDTVANDNVEWSFYVDGKIETYVIKKADLSLLAAGKVFELEKGADGVYTVKGGAEIAKAETAATVTVADAAFVVAGHNYSIDAKTVIFDVRMGHTGEAGTLEVGQQVDIIVASGTTAGVIYIVG